MKTWHSWFNSQEKTCKAGVQRKGSERLDVAEIAQKMVSCLNWQERLHGLHGALDAFV